MARRMAILLVVGGLLVVPSQAAIAKGPHRTSSAPPCTITPSTVAPMGTYTISASGLPATTAINIQVLYSSATQVFGGGTDATGFVSLTTTALGPDSVNVKIYDVSGKRQALLTSCSFTVA